MKTNVISYEELLAQKVVGKETAFTKNAFEWVANKLEQLLATHEDILIISDKDTDGITSAKITGDTVEARTGIKPKVVIGDRFDGKYGIPEVNKLPLKEGTLVICLDIGSTERERLDEIKAITGEYPLVIDHHIIAKDMKDYPLLVNFTGRKDAPDYCTAGLAKRIFDVIYDRHKDEIDTNYPQMKMTLDLFGCIGTIGDYVSVNNPNDLNAQIIKDGFKILDLPMSQIVRGIEPSFGRFLEQTGIFDKRFVTTGMIQYNVVPLLNACGRLEQGGSQYVFDTFYDYAYDREKAEEHIEHIVEVNEQRKAIKQEILNSEEYKDFKSDIVKNDKKIAVYVNDNIPQGIAGLIASDLTDTLGVPALVLAKDTNGNYVASGRNGEGFSSLFEFVDKAVDETVSIMVEIENEEKGEKKGTVTQEEKEAYKKQYIFAHGGHDDALGFTMHPVYLEVFKEALDMVYEDVEKPDITKTVLDTKGMTVEKLYALEPFGVDFPQPKVEMSVKVQDPKMLKKNPNWIKFEADGIDFVTFSCGEQVEAGKDMVVSGSLGINEFRKINLQVQFDEIHGIERTLGNDENSGGTKDKEKSSNSDVQEEDQNKEVITAKDIEKELPWDEEEIR